jgi:branched-chain amino acid transport system substrate-binding protein
MPLRTRLPLLIGLVGAFALAGVGTAAGATPDRSDPLVIAVEGPQSGAQSSNGRDQLRGAQLAARQANSRGGVLGRKVVVYAADDKGESRLARRVARRVISRGIPFVVGPFNSSVGLKNLSIYRSNRVLPVWNTSDDATQGAGATVQPMNSQIAPVEARHIIGTGAQSVAMLVDETANGAFTTGMADRLTGRLEAAGVAVTRIAYDPPDFNPDGSLQVPANFFPNLVNEALASSPDLVYISSYFPEGVKIAKALSAAGESPKCLMGLANVDNAFVSGTTLAEAQRCQFVGTPAAGQLPPARAYVQQYRRAFKTRPGVWGPFYYDSARTLFAAVERAGNVRYRSVGAALRRARNLRGATGPITIARNTGYRTNVPVFILRVNDKQRFVIAS